MLKKEDPADSLRGGGTRGWQPHKHTHIPHISLGHPPPCIHTHIPETCKENADHGTQDNLSYKSYIWVGPAAGSGER